MAEILTKVDPSCLAANEEAGHVVVVMDDGHEWSELERKLFVVVRVPLSKQEVEERFKVDGIPDALKIPRQQAIDAAKQSLIAQNEPVPNDIVLPYHPKVPAQIKQDLLATFFINRKDHPARKENIDTDLIPAAAIQVVLDSRQVLVDCAEEAKEAARAAVTEVPAVAALNLDEDVLESLHTKQIKEVAERENGGHQGEEVATQILLASKVGRDSVEKPLLAQITPHEIVELEL